MKHFYKVQAARVNKVSDDNKLFYYEQHDTINTKYFATPEAAVDYAIYEYSLCIFDQKHLYDYGRQGLLSALTFDKEFTAAEIEDSYIITVSVTRVSHL